MEQEQGKSRFEPFKKKQFLTSADKFENQNRFISRYTIQEEDRLFRKLLSRLYSWLNSLSGEETFFASKGEGNLIELESVLSFLKKQQLVKQVSFQTQRFNDAPAFATLDIVPQYSTDATNGVTSEKSLGHGFGRDTTDIFSRGIGEFLERYFLTLYHQKDFIVDSFKRISRRQKTLNLHDLAGFTSKQKEHFTKYRWDVDNLFAWEAGERVSTGEKTMLPAQLIYWNYLQFDGEPMLRESNTNGAGGMFTREEALLAGIYEIIQRDAFLIFWLNAITPPQIDPESVNDEHFQNLLAESKRYGFVMHCLNLTLDTRVPVFVVVIDDSSGNGPRYALGAGSCADPMKALLQACGEAWGVYYSLRSCADPSHTISLKDPYEPFRDYSIGGHQRLHISADGKMSDKYEFLLKGKVIPFSKIEFFMPKSFNNKKEELTFLIKRIESMGVGYEIYAKFVKNPLLKKLGYHVVKVIIPKFMPLYLNESRPTLEALRLREIPSQFGYTPKPVFNPFPHPFP